MDRFSITHPQAIFIHELSEIGNYAITKVTIQITSYETYSHTTKVIDISMDGLLFEVQNKKLFNYLKHHNIVKMNIPLDNQIELSLRGEIVRFIERENSFFLGVNFFDSNPDDMLHLESYLYEKSMNAISE
jgi:c-di-GMP-binding flagellar brake protein YcgR